MFGTSVASSAAAWYCGASSTDLSRPRNVQFLSFPQPKEQLKGCHSQNAPEAEMTEDIASADHA
jgi:hypothetical protein